MEMNAKVVFRTLDDLVAKLLAAGFRLDALEMFEERYKGHYYWIRRSSCRAGLYIFGHYFQRLQPEHMQSIDAWLHGCGFDPEKVPLELRQKDFTQVEKATFDYLLEKLSQTDGSPYVFQEAVNQNRFISGETHDIPGYARHQRAHVYSRHDATPGHGQFKVLLFPFFVIGNQPEPDFLDFEDWLTHIDD
jgi:hypothetical protein